jgi:general secretion pathway protein A
MYERFYHLRERPFALTPDPEYLFLSHGHREALDHLRLGIQGHAGFVVLTGEVGSGKTLLLQLLLRDLDRQATVVRLVTTLLDPRELLQAVLIDLGVTPVPDTKPALVSALAQALVRERARGRRVLIVIDEAQNLPRVTLEEMRMLSNLETEKAKLMQVVLVGQPEFRDRLANYDLEQLRQRVTVCHHLGPLEPQETGPYINHRLRVAALEKPLSMPRDVADAIHLRSGGIPRLINVICDAALMAGYGENRRVSLALVESVFRDLELAGLLRAVGPSYRPWRRAFVDPEWETDTARGRGEASPVPAAPKVEVRE